MVTCNRIEIPMSSSVQPRPSRSKVAAHRQRLRAQGLRPIQIWAPDVRSPEFAAEAHRQSLLVANSPYAEEDQAFVDSIADFGDE